jgi:metallo-beta-lactamase class B
MKAVDGGRTYDVVIIGSPNVNSGTSWWGNVQYPQMAKDFERTFRTLNSLPCDNLFWGLMGATTRWRRNTPG